MGRPNSLLNDPAGATVGPAAPNTAASMSFVLVFPLEPVKATTRVFGNRASTAWANSPNAETESATSMVRPSVGLLTIAATAPAANASATKSCPS